MVGEVVGEIRDAVADTNLGIIAEVAVDCRHSAPARVAGQIVGEIPGFDDAVPLLDRAPVETDDAKLGVAGNEPVRGPVKRDLALAIAVFAADGQRMREVEIDVDHADDAALFRAVDFAARGYLADRSQVLEIIEPRQHIQPVVEDGSIGKADNAFDIIGGAQAAAIVVGDRDVEATQSAQVGVQLY